MARKAMIEKDAKRWEKAKRYHAYRRELRNKSVDLSLSFEERMEAQQKLQSLPRDTSMTRVTYRCQLTGRARGNLRKFGLSRIAFRELASSGKIPGVTKSSW